MTGLSIEVREKITVVETETKIVKQSIDEFLDIVLWYQKRLEEISLNIQQLIDLVHVSYLADTKQTTESATEVMSKLNGLVVKGESVYRKLLKENRNCKDGFKTAMLGYFSEIERLKELCSDIKLVYIDIPKNSNIESLLKSISKSK